MRRRPVAFISVMLLLVPCLFGGGRAAEAQARLPRIEERTRDMERRDGFLPLYLSGGGERLYLEIPKLGQELIYVVSLPTGLGSNDVGLDRGELGGERIVRFERVGQKVLLVQPNLDYRADSDEPAVRRAVEESFAQSVLWGFRAEAESDGRVLVDATDFALRDWHGIAARLAGARQGAFRLDVSRSVLYLPRTKSFPRNTEVEATLTFTGDNPGQYVREVAPTPEAVTLRQRLSFVALPEPGYTPRIFDPRAGYNGVSYRDMAAPLERPQVRRFIARHRLQKKVPGTAASEAVAPIVYYLDRGAPEPMRTALLEGARWWNQAFEAAGYRDAFRVELLPEDADPMDIRYNVIEWVHRSTRGWSVGTTVTDPRTGEILKGLVRLGSLRVRQDYLLAEGLLSPYRTGDEDPPELSAMALARIRQLSAHEVGHTLGLSHNYVSSAQGRASVMDYPHPLVQLRADGSVDLSDAYTRGIGEWDKVAITYGYGDFPAEGEGAGLERLLTEAHRRGYTFLTDQDARPEGSAHPQAHLWDNGADAAAELARVMKVRRAALDRFGEAAIRRGMPLATLEETLVPLYLHHRYQVEAAVKLIGGQYYTFALRGDGQEPLQAVPAEDQRKALDALLATLNPAELVLPKELLAKIPPRPAGFGRHRELFDRYTGPTFDAVTPAASAAEMVVRLLLNPQRAARLVEQHALNPTLPGLREVLDRLSSAAAFKRVKERGRYEAVVTRAVQWQVVEGLITLAASARMPEVRAIALQSLERLRPDLLASGYADESDRALRRLMAEQIRKFLDRPYAPAERPEAPVIPPGAPIGDAPAEP